MQPRVALVVCDYTIENRLHWRRDVTLREDHCQVRIGTAPRVLAVLNSFLLAMLDFLNVSNVPKQMRQFDAHPLLAVRLLLGSLLTFKSMGAIQPYQWFAPTAFLKQQDSRVDGDENESG